MKKHFSALFLSFIVVSLYAPISEQGAAGLSSEAVDRIERIRKYHGNRDLRSQSPGGLSPLHGSIVLKKELERKQKEREKQLAAYLEMVEEYRVCDTVAPNGRVEVGFTPSEK